MSSNDTISEISDSLSDSEEYKPPAKRQKAPRRAAQEQTKSGPAGHKRANRKSYADLDDFEFEESGSDGELAAQAQAADQVLNLMLNRKLSGAASMTTACGPVHLPQGFRVTVCIMSESGWLVSYALLTAARAGCAHR